MTIAAALPPPVKPPTAPAAAPGQSPRELLAAIADRVPLVGSVWWDGHGERIVDQLVGPAIEVAGLDGWLREQAAAARGRETVAACPHVRNLHGVVVPADAGESIGVLVAGATDATLNELLLLLRLAASTRGRALQASGREQTARHLADTAALLEIVSRVEAGPTTDAALRTLAEAVAEWIGCETVAVVRARGRRLRGPVTVAGRADADPRSEPTRRLRAALAETVARDSLGHWRDDEATGEAAASMLAHQAAARDCRLAAVMSLPLQTLDPATGASAVVGAVLIGWTQGGERPDTGRAESLLHAAAQPLGSAVDAAVRGRRRGLACVVAAVGRRPVRAVLIAATLAAIVGGLMVPVPYRLACRSTCRPVVTRAAVAPHDGTLRRSLVEVGTEVQAGQTLGVMDDRELRLELASLTADRTRAVKDRDRKLADGAIAEGYVAEHEVDRLSQRIHLIELRLRQQRLLAPTAGVVLDSPGDRGDRVPVQIGEVLFEVAALDPIRLEVAIPAAEVDHVAAGQSVRFRPEGGGPVRDGIIERIAPRAEVRDDAAVFVADVTLANADGRLRPGTAGTGRVLTPPRPLGWCWLHRAWETVVMKWGW